MLTRPLDRGIFFAIVTLFLAQGVSVQTPVTRNFAFRLTMANNLLEGERGSRWERRNSNRVLINREANSFVWFTIRRNFPSLPLPSPCFSLLRAPPPPASPLPNIVY